MLKLCTPAERVQRSHVRVPAAVVPFGFATHAALGTGWNAMPSVYSTAICTFGKRYELAAPGDAHLTGGTIEKLLKPPDSIRRLSYFCPANNRTTKSIRERTVMVSTITTNQLTGQEPWRANALCASVDGAFASTFFQRRATGHRDRKADLRCVPGYG